MVDKSSSIAILGAGITGLSIAYALKKSGVEVAVYEKDPMAGGVIQTFQDNGWLVEKGPNTMLVRDDRIWDLLDELELIDRIAKPGSEAKKRYIIRGSSLCAAPMSLPDFLKTNLLSTSSKLRLLGEPFISAPDNERDDESIARFIRRRLGPEPLDYGVNPFVSGIYAGDPEALSIKHTFTPLYEMEQKHGSITKGFFKREKITSNSERALISFDDGLQVLPNAISQTLGEALKCSSKVNAISKKDHGWGLTIQRGKAEIKTNHRAVISTLPAQPLASIWEGEEPDKQPNTHGKDEAYAELFRILSEIEYAPMSVLALGFRRKQVKHALDGFGMLVPEKEPFSMLGCLFSSSLFEGRAPEEHVLLTCFMGGARHPDLASQPTQPLIDETIPQLHKLLGINGIPVFHHHTFWPQAIPQYTVGYDLSLQAMKQIEHQNPGFYLAGNYRGGVSVPDCILNGFEMADKAAGYLERSNHSK